jgi:hypothetical protein
MAIEWVRGPKREPGFPDMQAFPESHPGPYERNMGEVIVALLKLFAGRVPDSESNARVLELAGTSSRWSAGHAFFREVRHRSLAAIKAKDQLRATQYMFEELCCKAIYNATSPQDEFDPSSPFFVAPAAARLAHAIGVSAEEVTAVLVQSVW